MRAGSTRRGAMPVLFARMNHDGVTGGYLEGRVAPFLHTHSTVDDEQPLRPGVRVPVRAAAGLEFDTIDVHRHADIVGREAFGPRRASERIGVSDGELSCVAAKDL